jgi:hypothetical protein
MRIPWDLPFWLMDYSASGTMTAQKRLSFGSFKHAEFQHKSAHDVILF